MLQKSIKRSGDVNVHDGADVKRHFIQKICNSNKKVTGESASPNKLITESQSVYSSILEKEGGGDYGANDDDDDVDSDSDSDLEDDDDDPAGMDMSGDSDGASGGASGDASGGSSGGSSGGGSGGTRKRKLVKMEEMKTKNSRPKNPRTKAAGALQNLVDAVQIGTNNMDAS